ncbi:uncharacterized protein LOC133038577 [Cannabis sativa]|uniref:uncharacterized protein LOC133038577 n=1 Tax=Cannabis sativa TaxID=3483 RepID=UPI0029CA5E88|nr:uncharacterized protein LOC133038577 [Cannabis sativa]
MGWETLVTHPMLLFGYKYRELLSLLLTFVGALGEVRLGVLEGGFQEVGLAFHLVGCVGRRQGELIKFFELRRRSAIGTFYCLILLFETALYRITFPVNLKVYLILRIVLSLKLLYSKEVWRFWDANLYFYLN